MILTHLILKQLLHFRAKILRALLGGKQQSIFGICVANQTAS